MKINKYENIEGICRIGIIDYNNNAYEVYVNTDDVDVIPHFHVRFKNDWDVFNLAVKIDKPESFLYADINFELDKEFYDVLQEFMCSKPSSHFARFTNNWEMLCAVWDINNSNALVSDNITQPDYTKLK